MLVEFLLRNRGAIIARTQARVASRKYPKPSREELANGISVFLDQLGDALRLATSTDVIDHDQISASASRHGNDLLRMGLTIAQVVHDYGDICQAITELAVEQCAPIPAGDFQTLNLCLDDAIAGAVTEYSRQRERTIEDRGTERLGALAHELRNLLNTAMLSFEIIKSGQVAAGGSTGAVHFRSLMGLRDLIDRSLAEVRLDAGVEHRERILVSDFVEEIEIGAAMHARSRGLQFAASAVDRTVSIEGDRQSLASAVSNLLSNAFKFTRKGGSVLLTTRTTAERVLFDVEDECGGLPPGKVEELFHPYEQRGLDRSGLGLGLSISVKAAQVNGGEIRVRDLPGHGCVFTLDLPRNPLAPFSVFDGGKRRASSPEAMSGADAQGAVTPNARVT